MTVKTYRARSLQEALALVRQELGSQAAVLHTREVRSRGLARLWGGGELIEVVASDNVSVPGRLPDPYLNARDSSVPQAPSGIDLTELGSAVGQVAEPQTEVRSRVLAFLDQGVRPLAAAEARNRSLHFRGGVPLLVVCGGTTGAGATTISWGLAQALAQQGRRAVWVDADLNPRATETSQQNQGGTLADVLSGRRTVHEVLTLGPDGVQCIRRALGDHQVSFTASDVARCAEQLRRLAPHAEIVVVDAGSQTSCLQARLWQAATAVCVVVTPADDSILRGYAAIKHHREHSRGVELLTFVNHAEEIAAKGVSNRVAKACRQFLGLRVTPVGQLSAGCETQAVGHLERAADRLWTILESIEHQAASTQNL